MRDQVWLTAADVHRMHLEFRQSAKRLEQMPIYVSDVHTGGIDRWLAGQVGADEWRTESSPWLDLVREHAAAGRFFRRLRVHEDDPTPYQRIMREASRANVLAGEDQRYLTRSQADRLGLTVELGIGGSSTTRRWCCTTTPLIGASWPSSSPTRC